MSLITSPVILDTSSDCTSFEFHTTTRSTYFSGFRGDTSTGGGGTPSDFLNMSIHMCSCPWEMPGCIGVYRFLVSMCSGTRFCWRRMCRARRWSDSWLRSGWRCLPASTWRVEIGMIVCVCVHVHVNKCKCVGWYTVHMCINAYGRKWGVKGAFMDNLSKHHTALQ